jgi:hypothetical protein
MKEDEKASSSAAPPVKKNVKSKTRKEHGVELIENTTRSFWKKQNISLIKTQAELRGRRFTDLETKGENKFKKKEYLNALFEVLKIKKNNSFNYIIIFFII